jgi:hypothetical protein
MFIGILTIEPNKKTAIKLKKQVSENLKIPSDLIHLFVFPPEAHKEDIDKGISLNHQHIIRTAYKQNYKYVMVFEDDVVFYDKKNNHKLFLKAWKEKDSIKDWEALFMGGFNAGINYHTTPHLCRGTRTFGAHGYILNRKSMKKVLERDFTKIKNFMMFEASLNQFDISVLSNLRGYQVAPFILYQYKIPRLIKFADNIFDFDNGRYESFLFKWTNFLWILLIFVLFAIVYGIFHYKKITPFIQSIWKKIKI